MPKPPFPSEPNRLAAIADAARRLPAPEPAVDSLDAAWAEAEAALPEGWRFVELSNCLTDPGEPEQDGWRVCWLAFAAPAPLTILSAMEGIYDDGLNDYREHVEGSGPTPAAALRALAAALRERGR